MKNIKKTLFFNMLGKKYFDKKAPSLLPLIMAIMLNINQ